MNNNYIIGDIIEQPNYINKMMMLNIILIFSKLCACMSLRLINI